MISIIIPTLNEEHSLSLLLDAIGQQRADHEVIVVDGGSRDRTLDIARHHRIRTLFSRPGRGAALCAGATEAHGEVLFFLHADSMLPPRALDRINETLSADAGIVGGNFRLVFDGETPFSRRLTAFCAWIRWLGHYYGDSGIFVRRSAYDALGGFRPIPIMEDWEFVRRLERFGKTACIKDPPLITSSRRFERRRPVEIVYGWVRLHVLYWLGVSPDRLAEIYRTQVPSPPQRRCQTAARAEVVELHVSSSGQNPAGRCKSAGCALKLGKKSELPGSAACVRRDGRCRGLLRMRNFLNAIMGLS